MGFGFGRGRGDEVDLLGFVFKKGFFKNGNFLNLKSAVPGTVILMDAVLK